MGFWERKSEKVNASELSAKVQPIYESAYAICREFGCEEGSYFNYRYADQNIRIQHSNENGADDAFSPGKHVYVEYRGRCVFDCIIKQNGDIKSKVFESGEWTNYFSSLERAVKLTLLARKKLEEYYKFSDIFYTVVRKNSPNRNTGNISIYRDCSFSAGKFKINYDIERGYTFADDKIKIKFDRDEKKNVASAAVITFEGKMMFDAVHFFPSKERPFSSNTRCKVFERGEWEEYLVNAISDFKALLEA